MADPDSVRAFTRTSSPGIAQLAPTPRTYPVPQINRLGITELYRPDPTIDTIADIVFVHGLGGHPKQTWLYGKDLQTQPLPQRESSTKKSKFAGLLPARKPKDAGALAKNDPSGSPSNKLSSCFWPYDLLPKALPNVRVLTYGYDSHPTHFYKSPTNQMTITNHAEDLMHKVTAVRNDCRGRTLIFIAHSLGGILVKGALNESQQMMNRQPAYADLKQSCCATFFLGTPHQGADIAVWGQTLKNIVGALPGGVSTYSSVLQGLSPDSETLYSISRRFNELLNDSIPSKDKIQICSIQEGRGLSSIKGLDFKVRQIRANTSLSDLSRLFLIFRPNSIGPTSSRVSSTTQQIT
ncbi:hypothetical protein ES702_06131 [subsurface metagenome]